MIPREKLDVITSITTDKTEIELEKNRTYQAKATTSPADAIANRFFPPMPPFSVTMLTDVSLFRKRFSFSLMISQRSVSNAYRSGVSAGRRYHDYLFPNSPKRFGMMSGGGSVGEFYGEDGNPDSEAYIKLVKEGNKTLFVFTHDFPAFCI